MYGRHDARTYMEIMRENLEYRYLLEIENA